MFRLTIFLPKIQQPTFTKRLKFGGCCQVFDVKCKVCTLGQNATKNWRHHSPWKYARSARSVKSSKFQHVRKNLVCAWNWTILQIQPINDLNFQNLAFFLLIYCHLSQQQALEVGSFLKHLNSEGPQQSQIILQDNISFKPFKHFLLYFWLPQTAT